MGAPRSSPSQGPTGLLLPLLPRRSSLKGSSCVRLFPATFPCPSPRRCALSAWPPETKGGNAGAAAFTAGAFIGRRGHSILQSALSPCVCVWRPGLGGAWPRKRSWERPPAAPSCSHRLSPLSPPLDASTYPRSLIGSWRRFVRVEAGAGGDRKGPPPPPFFFASLQPPFPASLRRDGAPSVDAPSTRDWGHAGRGRGSECRWL